MKKIHRKILAVLPELAAGEYPVKTEIDKPFTVTAIVATKAPVELFLKYRLHSEKKWKEIPMTKMNSNRYSAEIKFNLTGLYYYTVVGINKNKSQFDYGKNLLVMVDPVYARFSAWYEIFPRSQGNIPGRSATFKDVENRLDYIKKLGFDILYMAPIHPIGITKRKGPNNSLSAGPNDPGSCWAIGNQFGGHKSVHPDLGTLEDFRALVIKAKEKGFETALDIGLQCSPDHPYVKEHPGWFHHEPDGTIRCAENPPKKYEDVYPLNFYPEDRRAMWEEMKSIFEFWISQGVNVFRIDNPHTKPTEFWKWCVLDIKKKYPDVIFLSEAFTYYEKLEELAAVGFTQSYGYFTWRSNKNELIEYFLKLTQTQLKLFLKMNLFVNTPDILPTPLQHGGRPAFMLRIALATTLSSAYGMYNGYELCENSAINGKEEYLHSEKYEHKVWDWDRPGNIKDYISRLNMIRKENPALWLYDNLRFLGSTNDHILCYSKISADEKNIIAVAVNLNPYSSQDTRLTLAVDEYGFSSGSVIKLEELISGKTYYSSEKDIYLRLNPHSNPACIFRISESNQKKPTNAKSHALATEHADIFFELREKVVKHNDSYARKDLEKFYTEAILQKIIYGDTHNAEYSQSINVEAQKFGFRTITHAYITTPGH